MRFAFDPAQSACYRYVAKIQMRRFLDCILPAVLISFAACGSNASSPTTPSPPTPVYAIGDLGVSAPTVVLSVKPSYTSAAIAAHVQGRVLLSAVVTPDGTVGEVTVVQSSTRPTDWTRRRSAP